MAPQKGDAEDGDSEQQKVPWWCSMRLALAFVGFLGFVNLYALRVNLSVGIVCMVNQTALLSDDAGGTSSGESWNTTASYSDEDTGHCASTVVKNTGSDGEFTWSKKTQGLILSSFYWGYLFTQVPGGWLAQRFGGKRVIGYSMLITTLATILTPVGARISPYMLMVLRLIEGMGEGTVYPCMHGIWSKWAPPMERSKLIGFTYAGAQIGSVVAMPVSGLLCDYGFAGGWPSIFYVFGMYGVVWFVLWMVIVSDTPEQHPRITEVERDYIVASNGGSRNNGKQRLSTPWMKIFKTPAFWGVVVGHFSTAWGTYTLISNIPTYMREVLKFDIKSNGFFSALPFLAFWAVISMAGILADWLRTKGLRTGTVRKLMQCLGTFPPGILLIVTSFLSCENPYAAVAILTVAVGFSGFHYSGCIVNHMDIAPPFAGIMLGLTNTFACTAGILSAVSVGYITVDQTHGQWKVVFFIAAAMYIVGAVIYCFLAEGEIQEWVKPYMLNPEHAEEKLSVLDGSTLLVETALDVPKTESTALKSPSSDVEMDD